ncbi:MAG: sulfatase [Planctomycetes bacterium]|nr:sulfatase [Planctomycetota bacterium]
MRNRRRRSAACALVLLAGCTLLANRSPAQAPATGAPATPARPNFVVILADDLGYADLGCQGSRFYESPAIDALAASGLRFTAGYANAPNCAPTRACLMSGRDTPHHGVWTVGSGARGRPANRASTPPPNRTELDTAFTTLPEALRARGYATAHFGKWHLGSPGSSGPLEHGFEYQVGGTAAGHPKSYFSPYGNAELPDGSDGEYLTDRLTDEAIAWLDRRDERPFFLYFAHYAVHTPIQARADDTAHFAEKAPDGEQRRPDYAGMIRALDRSVGRLLDALDDHGLTDDTVVVFTSDNGGVGGYAGLGTRDITDNRPLRGGKGMLYEGGIRVPFIVRWPGVTQAGATSAAPVLTYDLHPTLLAAAGPSAERTPARLDGVDLLPALRGGELPERDLVWHFPGYLEANAERGTWRTRPGSAIRRGSLKLIEWLETGQVELYDLAADPGEQRDLAREQPVRAAELLLRLRSWRSRHGAAMPAPLRD